MPKLDDVKEQWLYHAILVALATLLFFMVRTAIEDFNETMHEIENEVSQIRGAVTRFEERQASLADRFSSLARESDDQGALLYNHDWRIRRLEEYSKHIEKGGRTPGPPRGFEPRTPRQVPRQRQPSGSPGNAK